jgi:hypothetical protein
MVMPQALHPLASSNEKIDRQKVEALIEELLKAQVPQSGQVHRLDATHGFQSHPGLERRSMPLSLRFHLVVSFFLPPTPAVVHQTPKNPA